MTTDCTTIPVTYTDSNSACTNCKEALKGSCFCKFILVFLVIVVLAGAGGFGYFFFLNRLAIKEFDDNQVIIVEKSKTKETLTKARDTYKVKIVELKELINKKNVNITNLDNQIKVMNKNKTDIIENIKVVEGEIKSQVEKLVELDKQIKAKKEDIEKQKGQIAELEKKIADLKTEHDRVKSLLMYYYVGGGASLLANIGGGIWWYTLSRDIQNNTNVSIGLNNTLRELKNQIAVLNKNITDQKEINRQLNDTLNQKNIVIDNLTKVEKSLIDNITLLNRTRDDLKVECEKIRINITNLEKEYNNTNAELEKLNSQYKQLKKDYDNLNKTYNDTVVALQNLTIDMENLLKKKYAIGNETVLATKIYVDALAKNKLLLDNQTSLNSTHKNASANFTKLSEQFKIVNATYTEIIQNYTYLKGNYTVLNETFYNLTKNYDDLNKTYTQMQKEVIEVTGNCTELEKKNLDLSNKLLISSLDNIKMRVFEDVYNIKVNVAGTCYNSTAEGFVKTKFTNDCANKVNSLILIETADKSYFGGFIESELKLTDGAYPDPNAFTFSINNNELCTEHNVSQAYNTNSTTFFTFGNGDIVILPQVPENKNWTSGAVNASSSYKIPIGYDKTFYHNGDVVNITSVQVQQLSFSP